MTYQSLVSFEYWTFIAQILNLFIQIWLFKKFLFKPIKNIIAKRQQEVDTLYQQAEHAKEAAESDRESYEAHLRDVRAEAAEITKRAVETAKERSNYIVHDAERQANAIREKAGKDIELDRTRAMSEAKREISSMAIEIAEKIIDREINEADHKELIGKFIDQFGEK